MAPTSIPPLTIAVIEDPESGPPALSSFFDHEGCGEGYAIQTYGEQSAALADLVARSFDAIVVPVDPAEPTQFAILDSIRAIAPNVAIVVVLRQADEAMALRALQAGAQECLARPELTAPSLMRAIRFSRERAAYHTRMTEWSDRAAGDRELGGLGALCGPAPLPVTERSLGTRPLRDRFPDAFRDLAEAYGAVLDEALEQSFIAPGERRDEDLQTIGDQMGLLNAGPRDVIDLHKAAMTRRLDGKPARRVRGYVEEGRLVMLRLMGTLVTHYRTLSWVRGNDGRRTSAASTKRSPALSSPGKRSQ